MTLAVMPGFPRYCSYGCLNAMIDQKAEMIVMFGDCREGKLQATAYMHETKGHRSRMNGRDFATDVRHSERRDLSGFISG